VQDGQPVSAHNDVRHRCQQQATLPKVKSGQATAVLSTLPQLNLA